MTDTPTPHDMEEAAARKALEYVQELIAGMAAVCEALGNREQGKTIQATGHGLSAIDPAQFRTDRHD